MHRILIVRDANTGLDLRQKEVMLDLEQLQLHNWKYIKLFYNDFFALTTVSGNYYNPSLGEILFSKLPKELGKKIHKA